MDGFTYVLVMFAVSSLLYTCNVRGQVDSPHFPAVSDVVAYTGVAAGNASTTNKIVVIVRWSPVYTFSNVMFYRVYYDDADGSEIHKDVPNIANSLLIENLEEDEVHHFQVAAGFLIGDQLLEGPRSAITENSTVNATQSILVSDDGTLAKLAVAVFGMVTFASIVINIILLVVSAVLLRLLRKSYQYLGQTHCNKSVAKKELFCAKKASTAPSPNWSDKTTPPHIVITNTPNICANGQASPPPPPSYEREVTVEVTAEKEDLDACQEQ